MWSCGSGRTDGLPSAPGLSGTRHDLHLLFLGMAGVWKVVGTSLGLSFPSRTVGSCGKEGAHGTATPVPSPALLPSPALCPAPSPYIVQGRDGGKRGPPSTVGKAGGQWRGSLWLCLGMSTPRRFFLAFGSSGVHLPWEGLRRARPPERQKMRYTLSTIDVCL